MKKSLVIFTALVMSVSANATITGYTISLSVNPNNHGESTLYSIDPLSPIGGPSGLYYLDTMDISPLDGQIYTIVQASLYKMNPQTGIGSFIRDNMYGTTGGYVSLSFAPDGTLYALINGRLWEIDTATGNKTNIGSLGSAFYSTGLAINSQGEATVYDISRRELLEIDLTDASVSSIGVLPPDIVSLNDFDYGPDDILYARSAFGLYRIDAENLGYILLSDLPWGCSLATIPEPATLSLLAFGGLLLRKRK